MARDYITIGNTRDKIISALHDVQATLTSKLQHYEEKGRIQEYIRIQSIIANMIIDSESEQSEQRCKIVLDILDAIR